MVVFFFFFFTWRGFALDHVLWLGAEVQSELHGGWCRGWGNISTHITPQEDINVVQFKPAVPNHWARSGPKIIWYNAKQLCLKTLWLCLRNVNIYDCLSAESALFQTTFWTLKCLKTLNYFSHSGTRTFRKFTDVTFVFHNFYMYLYF